MKDRGTVMLTVEIEKGLHRDAKVLAAQRGLSLRELVSEGLERVLDGPGPGYVIVDGKRTKIVTFGRIPPARVRVVVGKTVDEWRRIPKDEKARLVAKVNDRNRKDQEAK